MPIITIRPVAAEDHPKYVFPVTEYAFFASPPLSSDEERQERIRIPNERDVLVLFEDDRPLAVAGNIPMTQNVRGKIFSMGGIAPVATLPQARRKGYARQLMYAHFQGLHESGHVFTGLYPFRESFYERLGYITFPQIRIARFSATALTPLLKWPLEGDVEFMHQRDGLEVWRAFMLERQKHIHGMACHPPGVAAQFNQRSEKWLAIARHQGEIIGLMTYKINDYRDRLRADNFYYVNSQGKYLLLSWLARHADQVREIDLELPAYETAEAWLADMDIKFRSTDWVTPMGRVLDVRGIGGMQIGDGSFMARITDNDCPWNEGIFRFATVSGRLEVSEASHADITLTIQGLSALVFGTHDPDDFGLRGWAGGVDETVVATLRQMFTPRLPHMHEPY